MKSASKFLSTLSEDKKEIFYTLIAFPDSFSLEWFSGISHIRISHLVSIIVSLDQNLWISPLDDKTGFYKWTEKFPRKEFLKLIPPEMIYRYYREAVDMLQRFLPDTEASTVNIAYQCLSAGIESADIDTIYRAAVIEENNYHLSSAIKLYHTILSYIDTYLADDMTTPSQDMLYIFLQALERLVPYSLFDPNQKKIRRRLSIGLDIALHLEDKRFQASLQLLFGFYYWMAFEYKKSTYHFDQGWAMVQDIDDRELYQRGFRLQGLSLWLKGKMCEAVRVYEQSLGNLEFLANDVLAYATALHLAQSYTQIGMPQRGLGISETILQRTQKQGHWPMAGYALITTGNILLELRQLENSWDYFERAIELATREHLPMQRAMAVLGLSKIECLRGNFAAASEHFKIIASIRRSSWHHFFNLYTVFDTGYRLYEQNLYPENMYVFFDYVDQLTMDQLNPLLYGMIKRLHMKYLEPDMLAEIKLQHLIEIDKMVKQTGDTVELAKIRISIAIYSRQVNDWEKVNKYGRLAWNFLKPIAKDAFPTNLKHLITDEERTNENQLFDLIVEIGEALSNQESIEQLLTNIITSISRLVGAERTALFIKNKESSNLQLVGSRNLMHENIQDPGFRKYYEEILSAANSTDGQIIEKKIPDSDSESRRHVVITPLMLDKKVAGVLYQDSRFFAFDTSTDTYKLLSALGTQIAVSIDRAQAYDEIAQLNKTLLRENQYYREEQEEYRTFGDIIGTSEGIRHVQRLVHKVALTQSTVFIRGETGVGKELIARAIHNTSTRHDKPFIRVNCAALPDSLIDSELFGHEKGAFTGAIKTRAGRFELAHNGTIFLDEVSELPPQTQSRLLRILQEKEFQRVGGTQTLFSDFRLIAASNKNLEKEVAQGNFRPDLYYRLNIFPILVPPLRERIEDIPLLANYFLKLYCGQYHKPFHGIPEPEMEKLMAYSWPGNIRELSNMIERTVILGKPKFDLVDIEIRKSIDRHDEKFMDVKEFEKAQIIKALRQTKGQVGGSGGAARLLGIKRTTLMSRMKRYNISVEKLVG